MCINMCTVLVRYWGHPEMCFCYCCKCHGSLRYSCSFCPPVLEVDVTSLLGFTELDSLSSTPITHTWFPFPLISMLYMCLLFSIVLVGYCSHVRWLCDYLCVVSASVPCIFVHYGSRPVSFYDVYPHSFVWVRPSGLYTCLFWVY